MGFNDIVVVIVHTGRFVLLSQGGVVKRCFKFAVRLLELSCSSLLICAVRRYSSGFFNFHVEQNVP